MKTEGHPPRRFPRQVSDPPRSRWANCLLDLQSFHGTSRPLKVVTLITIVCPPVQDLRASRSSHCRTVIPCVRKKGCLYGFSKCWPLTQVIYFTQSISSRSAPRQWASRYE